MFNNVRERMWCMALIEMGDMVFSVMMGTKVV